MHVKFLKLLHQILTRSLSITLQTTLRQGAKELIKSKKKNQLTDTTELIPTTPKISEPRFLYQYFGSFVQEQIVSQVIYFLNQFTFQVYFRSSLSYIFVIIGGGELTRFGFYL